MKPEFYKKAPWAQNVPPCPLCDSAEVCAIPSFDRFGGRRVTGKCFNCGYQSGVSAWNNICAVLERRLKAQHDKRRLKLRQKRTPPQCSSYLEDALRRMANDDM